MIAEERADNRTVEDIRRQIREFDLAGFLARLGMRFEQDGNNRLAAQCPLPDHEDHHPSFKVYKSSNSWYCFGCHRGGDVAHFVALYQGLDLRRDFRTILATLGLGAGRPLRLAPAPKRPIPFEKANHAELGEPTAVYAYRDADGNLSYEVVRYGNGANKTFKQRRPNPRGGVIWNIDKVEKLIYRLPELLAAPTAPVYVVEGEKDVDRLAGLGLVATCNSGGAGKWPEAMNVYLADRDVVIFPDNDANGQQHASEVARSLAGVARSIKVVQLPDQAEKADASDFLDHTGMGADALRMGAMMTPEYMQSSTGVLADVGGIEAGDIAIALQEENAELRQRLDFADRLLMESNDTLQQNHRLYLYRLQRLMDKKELQVGDRFETTRDELAQIWGTSAGTASRTLDALNGSGLHLIDHATKSTPRLDRNGVVIKRHDGKPFVDRSTVVELHARPIDLDLSTLTSPKGKEGFSHGGYRTRCRNGHKMEVTHYCRTCQELYDADGKFLGAIMEDSVDDPVRPAPTDQDDPCIEHLTDHLDPRSEEVLPRPELVSTGRTDYRLAPWERTVARKYAALERLRLASLPKSTTDQLDPTPEAPSKYGEPPVWATPPPNPCPKCGQSDYRWLASGSGWVCPCWMLKEADSDG